MSLLIRRIPLYCQPDSQSPEDIDSDNHTEHEAVATCGLCPVRTGGSAIVVVDSGSV